MKEQTREKVKKATTDIAAAIEAGSALAEANDVPEVKRDDQGRPYYMRQANSSFPTFEFKDLSDFEPTPRRVRQVVTLDTPGAFVDYVKLFANPTQTLIFATQVGVSGVFHAVLDWHASITQPSWLDHQARVTLSHPPAWVAWATKNGEKQNQTDFAQFLENHIAEIATPDGAELVEIARTLEASKGVSFKSHQRAQDGAVRFLFEEDVQGTAKNGQVTIPSAFQLVLTPFRGGTPRQIEARLRYRISGSALTLWFELVELDRHLEEAFTEAVDYIRAGTSGAVKAVVLGKANVA